MNNKLIHRLVVGFLMVIASCVADAQSGGPFTLNWNTIESSGTCNGGITPLGGTKFGLSGAVGQPDAGVCTADTYTLQGGFLPAFQKTVGPALRVQASRGGLLASWPASCNGFVLEGGATLIATQWTSVGSEFVFGADRVVPVAANSSYQFFRLRKDCPK